MEPSNKTGDTKPAMLAGLSVLGAVVASSCCVVPLVLFGLGISGAWIGNITALAPYQSYFIAVTLVFLGAGYWTVYRMAPAARSDDSQCVRPASRRLVKGALWLSTVLVILGWALPFLTPFILET